MSFAWLDTASVASTEIEANSANATVLNKTTETTIAIRFIPLSSVTMTDGGVPADYEGLLPRVTTGRSGIPAETSRRELPCPPKTSDALSRCPIDAGTAVPHCTPDGPAGPDRHLSSIATRSMAVLSGFLLVGSGAGPILVPRIRSRGMVPEPRPSRGLRYAVGRILDEPKSTRSARRVPRRAALGHCRHACVSVPRWTRGLLRVRPRPPDGTLAG